MINLDPAVSSLPFKPNIDIQDVVDYKQVMKDFRLGPNGAIMTSLNLFTTKFEQVLDLIDQRSDSIDYAIVDTPGQIEIFTWSASGAIITEAMANNGNSTILLYIIDTPKCTNPTTFMSNMLYACSIMYKAKLPFIIVFNKTDIVSHEFAIVSKDCYYYYYYYKIIIITYITFNYIIPSKLLVVKLHSCYLISTNLTFCFRIGCRIMRYFRKLW